MIGELLCDLGGVGRDKEKYVWRIKENKEKKLIHDRVVNGGMVGKEIL